MIKLLWQSAGYNFPYVFILMPNFRKKGNKTQIFHILSLNPPQSVLYNVLITNKCDHHKKEGIYMFITIILVLLVLSLLRRGCFFYPFGMWYHRRPPMGPHHFGGPMGGGHFGGGPGGPGGFGGHGPHGGF